MSAALSLAALLVLGSAVATDLRWAGAAIAVASSPASPAPAAETPAAGQATLETVGGHPPATDGLILALLADGRLFAVDHAGGRAIAEVKLVDPSSDLGQTPGHCLALGRDGTALFALLLDESDPPGGSRLAAVNPVTLRVLTPNLLAGRDVTHRSLAVGPATGRLDLFGNRGRDAVVSVLDPAGRPLAEWGLRASGGRDRRVDKGAVDDDERRLYVSYHGEDTTGIDSVDLVLGGGGRCDARSEGEGLACIPGHGGFAPYGDRFIVATGHPALIEIGPDRAVRRELEAGLEGNHPMEVVVDDEADRLYAVGSCGYTGGFAEVALRHRSPAAAEPRVPVPPQAGGPVAADVPCDERVVLGPNGVVVARTAASIARADARGALLTVDVATGETVGQVETPAEPRDLLVLPSHVARCANNQRE